MKYTIFLDKLKEANISFSSQFDAEVMAIFAFTYFPSVDYQLLNQFDNTGSLFEKFQTIAALNLKGKQHLKPIRHRAAKTDFWKFLMALCGFFPAKTTTPPKPKKPKLRDIRDPKGSIPPYLSEKADTLVSISGGVVTTESRYQRLFEDYDDK